MTTDMTMTKKDSMRKRLLPELVTQATAARMIGIARQNVPGLIVRGVLVTEVVAGQTLVTKASAAAEGLRRREEEAARRGGGLADAA